LNLHDTYIEQLCPTRVPVEGFVRPSFGVRCSKIILHIKQPFLILIILNLTCLMQVVLSATLSHLLTLQLIFECFQYV